MKKIIISASVLAMPLMAAAQTATLNTILTTIRSLANSIVPLFMVIAVAVFLWGIVKYITAAGDEEKEKSGRGYIIYGLIGIFVMVAFWGIITLVADTFKVNTGQNIQVPTFNP